MNSIILTVNALLDGELRHVKDGALKFGQFQGCSPTFKDQENDAIWVAGWNGTAEKIANIEAGSLYEVEGNLEIEEKDKFKQYRVNAYKITPVKGSTTNFVSLIGNLGGDPDVKYFESGKVKVRFGLAVRNPRSEKPFWFDVEIWEKPAEVVANYCRKGYQIGITGQLKIENWADKETGKNRFKYLINANNVTLLGKSGESKPSVADDDDF